MSTIEKKKQTLIEDYQKAVLKYNKENQKIEQKINDIKTTLKINQNLLFDYILKTYENKDEVKTLVNETKKTWEEAQYYIEENNNLQTKISFFQELLEDTPTKIREEINDLTSSTNKAKEQIKEKDNKINTLKKVLEKLREDAMFKKARKEVYVTEPTKTNVELGQELFILKSILDKVNPIYLKMSEEVNNYKDKIGQLREVWKKLIEKAINIHNKMNPQLGKISNNSDNKEDLKNLLNNIHGYDTNINMDKSEEEYEDDDDMLNDDKNQDDSDDQENESNSKKNLKVKENELKKLTEEYTNLKCQSKDYETRINKYKQQYKEYKSKIQKLMESTTDG